MFSTPKICELLFILVKIRDIDIVGRKETFSVLIIFVNLNILIPFSVAKRVDKFAREV